jgi:hypothetical protein
VPQWVRLFWGDTMEAKAACEADSEKHHLFGRAAFHSHALRHNELTAQGYRILHWTQQGMANAPDELIRQLRWALGEVCSYDGALP